MVVRLCRNLDYFICEPQALSNVEKQSKYLPTKTSERSK